MASIHFLGVALMFIVICVNAPKSYAQAGFLSIDCGYTGANYQDNRSLQWVSDNGTYSKTGKNSGEVFFESTISENQALRSYRFFPEGRSKYCYELPTEDPQEISFLFRASFYMNESVLKATRPFKFILSIDGTEWFTVTSGDDSQTSLQIVQEGIFYPATEVTYFCLRPVNGVPFISSLEVRGLLRNSLYLYNGWTTQYLTLISRYNTGANSTALDVRYPDDSYDRIWKTPDASLVDILPIISGPGDPSSLQQDQVSLNFVPLKVMQDAWLFQPGDYTDDGTSKVTFELFEYSPQLYLNPGQYVYVIVYAEDLNTTASRFGHVITSDIIGGDWSRAESDSQTFNSSTINMMALPFFYTASNIINASFSLCSLETTYDTCNGTDGRLASMNAVEIYGQHDYNFSRTNPDDDQVITGLKTVLSLTDWQGDPCVPVPHDWLSCDLDLSQRNPIYYVTSINISSGILKVTTSSNISLSRLNKMSITKSGVDDPTFQLLLNYSSPTLSLLNLSDNALTSPTRWGNITKSLGVLDLSRNQLEGPISSLDNWIQRSTLSLQELYIHDNNLNGSFSSSLYFSSIPTLTVGNFDQNSIQGTLDLSAWFAAMEKGTSTLGLFSFVNNSISNIIPSVETIGSVVQNLLLGDKMHGILLGGNPYCKNAKSYMQRYLCRSTIHDVVKEDTNNKPKILIIGLSAGGFVLLLSSVFSVILWRLWKKVFTLREIQKALIDRKVQPPLYQYSDLKIATRDFHYENKLGTGGFGVVYKGVLLDQTPVAVKKLFDSKSMQALDDFLNEVMLITGIKHRNLIQLKGCCIKDKQRMLVYEYAEKGNLAEALWGSKAHCSLSWEKRFSICLGVARGLSYLHEELQPCIIHRDIKPENVLLDKDFKSKIADFGLARHFFGEESGAYYTQISQVAGTRGYLAPEYALHGQLSEKADVYSYGILVLEVLCGRKSIDLSLPVQERVLKDWVRWMRNKGSIYDILQLELRDNFVESEVVRAMNIGLLCTQYYPEMRPSMSQVVTMFLGRMDIQVLDEFEQLHPTDFKDLLATINHKMDYLGLESIQEDLPTSPLLNVSSLNSQYSMTNTSLGSSSKALHVVELSNLHGR